jgi:hypothetical protein
MTRCNLQRFILALVILVLPASNARAQETREAQIAAEQAKKAAESKPYEPGGGERWAVKLRKEFLDEPSGFYPYFGSVYSGGGFTLGAGYRQFYADRTHWDVKGLYSFKNYKLIEFSTDSWALMQGKVDLHARIGWRDATQVAYYGLGNDSPDIRSNYGLTQTYFGGDVQARPGYYTVFNAGLMYENYSMGEGAGNAPSIEEIHTPATAPGLGVSPSYLHTMLSAGIDWRRPGPGYARSGGLYQIVYHSYADNDQVFSFDQIDYEAVQHVPLLRETWVLSFHGLVQTTPNTNDTVPYFLMPYVGSGSTLRAYPSRRFRDRHSLLLSGEFRWIPNRLGMDMALFYDMGKVASDLNDLEINHTKHNVGVGVRFHGPFATPLRIELAKGREGMNLVFSGSAAF